MRTPYNPNQSPRVIIIQKLYGSFFNDEKDLTFAKQIERAAVNASKELKKAQQKREAQQKEALGMADELVAEENEGGDSTAKAGVSSLAAIGGGGGVGRGQDLEKEGVNIANDQLAELKDIAEKLNVDWDELKPEEQDQLKAFKKQMDKDVEDGNIQQGVADAAMENLIRQQKAQKDDKEVARLGKVNDLAGLGKDEIENAPEAEKLKGVQDLLTKLADPNKSDAVDREQAALEFEERGMEGIAKTIRNMQIAIGDFDDPDAPKPEGEDAENFEERFARLQKNEKPPTQEEMDKMDSKERVEAEKRISEDGNLMSQANMQLQAGKDRNNPFAKKGLNLFKKNGSGENGDGVVAENPIAENPIAPLPENNLEQELANAIAEAEAQLNAPIEEPQPPPLPPLPDDPFAPVPNIAEDDPPLPDVPIQDQGDMTEDWLKDDIAKADKMLAEMKASGLFDFPDEAEAEGLAETPLVDQASETPLPLSDEPFVPLTPEQIATATITDTEGNTTDMEGNLIEQAMAVPEDENASDKVVDKLTETNELLKKFLQDTGGEVTNGLQVEVIG